MGIGEEEEEEKRRLIPATRRRRPWMVRWRSVSGRRRRATVQLGKRRGWWWRRSAGGRIVFGMMRRMKLKLKLRYLVLKYERVMKKLSKIYKEMLKALVQGNGCSDAVQARIMMETYFAVPILPVSLTMSASDLYLR